MVYKYVFQKPVGEYFASILAQTYDNLELIFVNDGSTDRTEEIARSYREALEQRGIIYKYLSQPNGGQAKAMNTGFREMTGKYLVWPDSDDLLDSESIEKRAAFLESNPVFLFVRSNGDYFDFETGRRTGPLTYSENRFNEDIFLDLILEETYCACGCYMIRTDTLREIYPDLKIYETVRRRSSSGGVFSALAEFVIERGGSVCAAAYDEHFEVRHILIDSLETINCLRGAKYAQSRTENWFPVIRERLAAGQWMLFVGTPCQCAGLKAYLGREYEKLLVVDMVCHGVPSLKVWPRYLREQEQSAGSRLESVNLRSKSTGWSRYAYSVKMDFENGSAYSVPQGQDLFMQGFVRNLYLRPSCADCSFKGTARCSDLTLGDYWGIWDQHPEFDDNRGTSLLLLYSEKGRAVWRHISGKFRVLDVTVQDAIAQNPSAVHSSAPHPRRAEFFRELETASVKLSIQHTLEPPKEGIVKRLTRRIGRK